MPVASRDARSGKLHRLPVKPLGPHRLAGLNGGHSAQCASDARVQASDCHTADRRPVCSRRRRLWRCALRVAAAKPDWGMGGGGHGNLHTGGRRNSPVTAAGSPRGWPSTARAQRPRRRLSPSAQLLRAAAPRAPNSAAGTATATGRMVAGGTRSRSTARRRKSPPFRRSRCCSLFPRDRMVVPTMFAWTLRADAEHRPARARGTADARAACPGAAPTSGGWPLARQRDSRVPRLTQRERRVGCRW